MAALTIDANGIITGLIVWIIINILTWIVKRFVSHMNLAPYLFAIIVIVPLSLVNLFLICGNFNLDYKDYYYPFLFTLLFVLTHILIWKLPGVSRQGKKIIKMFSQTGGRVLTETEIMKALNLSVHKFDSSIERLIKSKHLETDGDLLNYNGQKYWLTKRGRAFLGRRLLL